MPCCAVARVIEQCCFNSTPDPFNGQTANFILKPPKVIESWTHVKKANLEGYLNNTVLSLWQQYNTACLFLGNAALLLLRSLSGLFLLASNDYDKELRKLQEITPDDFLIHLSTNAEK